jgi:hypothetical protein
MIKNLRTPISKLALQRRRFITTNPFQSHSNSMKIFRPIPIVRRVLYRPPHIVQQRRVIPRMINQGIVRRTPINLLNNRINNRVNNRVNNRLINNKFNPVANRQYMQQINRRSISLNHRHGVYQNNRPVIFQNSGRIANQRIILHNINQQSHYQQPHTKWPHV